MPASHPQPADRAERLLDRYTIGAEYRIENPDFNLLYEGPLRRFLNSAALVRGLSPANLLNQPMTKVAARARMLAIADLVPAASVGRVFEFVGGTSELHKISWDRFVNALDAAKLTRVQGEFLLAHLNLRIDGVELSGAPDDWSYELSPFQWACAIGAERFVAASISSKGIQAMDGVNCYGWSGIDIASANDQPKVAEELVRLGSPPAGRVVELLLQEYGL